VTPRPEPRDVPADHGRNHAQGGSGMAWPEAREVPADRGRNHAQGGSGTPRSEGHDARAGAMTVREAGR
jgi:hypothetical protein